MLHVVRNTPSYVKIVFLFFGRVRESECTHNNHPIRRMLLNEMRLMKIVKTTHSIELRESDACLRICTLNGTNMEIENQPTESE